MQDEREDKFLLSNQSVYSGDDEKEDETTTYEEAIVKTGYGCFHYRLLALCGWALSSDAIEILSISFILPPATNELKLSATEKGWLNSSIFLGMMIGGYFWGSLADLKGRRAVLLWSLGLNALGGLLSSFAQAYWLFLLLRIVSGIGVGGSLPVIFAYYAEFQGKARRGTMISLLATFWMCGNIVAAGLAWAVIPRAIGTASPGFTYSSWRIYLALCVIPSLTSALLFVLMPESPKFLMEDGREQEAIHVLRMMHASNTSRKDVHTEYPVKRLVVGYEASTELDAEVQIVQERGCCQSTMLKLKQLFRSTQMLFQAPLTSVTVTMIIVFFTISFGYYGLFMWFPELFQRMEMYGGSACAKGTDARNSSGPPGVDSDIYLDGFLTAVSNLPGNILCILIIDRVGRKPLLASSMVLSGLCVFFIWFVKTKSDGVIMSCVFSGVSVIAFNVLDVLCAELFPTKLRSTATGVLSGIGRIAAILGNIAFAQMVDTHCAVPMLLVAALLTVGGLSSIKLPNSMHRDLL